MHYHYTDKDTFERDIAEGKFLEYAYVHDNIYGTSIKAVKDVAESGKCCILDIDVQGARQVRASGLPALFVFISPPSLDELERRLRGRGTESEEQITTRLRNARDEMASLEETGLYDHIIINSELESCFKELQTVAARALAGETGPPEINITQPGSTRSALREPTSATISLQGWLGDTGSPFPVTPLAHGPAILHAGLIRWRGRVALVTGASSGVGWAASLALACAGVKVVAVSRGKAQLEALQEAASASGVPPNDFLPVVCDLTKEAEVTALPRIVTRRWPGAGIDILINAVGAGKKGGNTSSTDSADSSLLLGSSSAWVEAISAGVLGTALVSREAVSDMKKRGEAGHVINIICSTDQDSNATAKTPLGSTALGGSGNRGMQAVATAASKAMTEELRTEIAAIGANIKVSCVVAGAIAASDEHTDSKLSVEDIVAAIAFCLTAPPHADVNQIVVRAVQPHSSSTPAE